MNKFTQKRQIVYDLLKSSEAPLSAEDLYNKLTDEQMNLSTVYRALEKFHQDGLVGRNYLDNTAYYFLNNHEHHHFMVCEKCKEKFEIDCHIDEMIDEIKDKYGFEVVHHDLNFYGLCSNCQKNS